jgi:HEAT repeat protein
MPLRVRDVLLPSGLLLWAMAVQGVDPAAMSDYGLFPALPVAFFIGLGLVMVSVVLVLTAAEMSPVRLGLHLAGMVLVLHGTAPLVFEMPIYPWVYKHVGVVDYITVHGRVDTGIDIYQNWPGFFALAALFGPVAGVASPLAFAAWAPVYFNLLSCLLLGFVFRSLGVSPRVRWIGLFLFVAGNWVGQDYFAPQALAFVLSLAVFGMMLAWFRADLSPAPVRLARRLVSRFRGPAPDSSPPAETAPPPPRGSRVARLTVLLAVFAVVVVTHQLSPFVVLVGAIALAFVGKVRPRWVVAVMTGVTVAYLLAHLSYVESTQDLLGSVLNPFDNLNGNGVGGGEAAPGRRLTALGAPLLILGLWGLAFLGAIRRFRSRRPTLVIALLAASPVLIALGQSYGGEAVFRIYLFSLPWTALLAAAALEPCVRHRAYSVLAVAVAVPVAVVLMLSAFFGSMELYEVRPGSVRASQHFYDHARPGSVLAFAGPGFPVRVKASYDQFVIPPGDSKPNFLALDGFRHRMLGREDLPALGRFMEENAAGSGVDAYLALTAEQEVSAEVLGILPEGSLTSLERALAESPEWRVFYRAPDAVVYQFLGGPVLGPADGNSLRSAPTTAPPPVRQERSVDWLALGTALLGLGLLIRVLARRRTATARKTSTTPNKEKPMTIPDNAGALALVPPTAAASMPPPSDRPIREMPVADVGVLLRQAVAAPPPQREPYQVAIANLESEPARLRELVAGVEPGQRAAAVLVLRQAWGAVPPAQLRPLLGDGCAAVRAASAVALDHSPESIAVVQNLLATDLVADVRKAAVRAHAGAGELDQLAALASALADPDGGVRACAVDVLPVAGSARGAQLLLAATEDGDERVRRAAYRRIALTPTWLLWMAVVRSSRRDELCRELRAVASSRLAGIVSERWFSPEPADRALALEIAGMVDTPGVVDEALIALHDREAAVRRAAAGQLHGHSDGVAELACALHDDPDPTVRAAAGRALADIDTDDALLAFVTALEDPDTDVRRLAVDALLRRRSAGLARHLSARLTATNAHSVGEVLVRMGDPGEDALVDTLLEAPGDRASAAGDLLRHAGGTGRLIEDLAAVEPSARFRAVEALGALGGPDAQAGLITALADSWPGIRSRAAFHLGRVGTAGSRLALQRVSEHDQASEVVRAAAEALEAGDPRGGAPTIPSSCGSRR